MKTVAFVPIKLNNERLPNKNTLEFDNGKPLLCYIFESLKKVKDIDEIYVYCSNENIKQFLPDGINFLKRSKDLDSSYTKINEIIHSFINDVPSNLYILTHATAPFISPASIEKGLEAVKSGKYDSSCSVKRLQEFIWIDNEPFNYDPSAIPRTQDLKPLYAETSGFYIFNRELAIQDNRRIGYSPYLVEVSDIESIDIDEKDDFIIANAIFNNIINKD